MVSVMDTEWDNERSRPLKPRLEDTYGSESDNDLNPRSDTEINTSESSLSYGSSKNSEVINPAFTVFATDENLGTCPPSASSSSATSSEDLFRVITTAIIRPHTDVYCADKLEDNSRASPKDYVSGDSSAKLEETEHRSFGPASTSRVSDIESIVHKLSSTQSPPVQVMDRSGGYEQYRIPSSVFARSKPSTPVEWSIASNESLFSIQIENSSFSRDHFIPWGGDMPKPVELPRSSELIPSSSQPPGEAVMLDDDSSAGVEKILKANQKSVGFTRENNDCQMKEKTLNNAVGPINSSKYSDESGTSAQSFSFSNTD